MLLFKNFNFLYNKKTAHYGLFFYVYSAMIDSVIFSVRSAINHAIWFFYHISNDY